jgi:hypothetical protein
MKAGFAVEGIVTLSRLGGEYELMPVPDPAA